MIFNSGSNSTVRLDIQDSAANTSYFDDFSLGIAANHSKAYGGSSYDTVKDNYIVNSSSDLRDGCGIFAQFPKNIIIEHNEIRNMPYDGNASGIETAYNDIINNALIS